MIDPRRLHVLRVVDLHGTVTAAAAALHLSPSAVSQQIRQLSREVGSELFEREGRTVRLSAAAHLLLAYANRVAEEWESVAGRLAARDTVVAGELKLCGFATGIAALLAPAAARLREQHSAVTVHLVEAGTADCLERLLTRTSDIALVSAPGTPPLTDPRFDQEVLLADPQDLVVPATHPLATREQVRLRDAAADTWIAPHEDQRQLIEVSCAAAGFAPRFVHQADEWNAVLALVEHGMGVCLLPRLAPVSAGRSVRRVPILGGRGPVRQVVTCFRRGSADQPLVRHGLAALRVVAEGCRRGT